MKRPPGGSRNSPDQVIGIVRGTRSGYAFLIRDDGGEDLRIPISGLGGAIHGDRVRAEIVRSSSDFRDDAIVDEILSRPNPRFTGDLLRERKAIFVRPDSPMLPERMALQLGSHHPVVGAKILFRVENTGRRLNAPIAIFEEMIGEAGDARLDPVVIAMEFGIPARFSDEAMAVAERAVADPPAGEDRGRQSFREDLVLTIDPVDAKDFDDAVSLARERDGTFTLTVHVADVTAYVPEGSVLDQEAFERGTSTYFPGTVFPMLPEEISNGAASLSPDTDKRTVAVRIRFSETGEYGSSSMSKGWIRSRARLHYDQVQQILDGGDASALGVADEEVVRALFRMRELAALLRERRFRDGGFELDVPEAHLELRGDGVPKKIVRRRHEASHWLIEEFMIAANRTVGAWAQKRALPFLYRVHEEPERAALEEFAEVARTLRPGTPASAFASQRGLREWLGALPAGAFTRVLHRFFLRSMKKAVYAAVDLGHYGLGIDRYCHFTSPIRRYPDLFNHRRIKEHLDQITRADLNLEASEAIALFASRREVNAERAEREIIRLKSVRYLEERLGKEAPAHVTAITRRGLFVELDRVPVEGFVPAQTLPDRAHFVEERLSWLDPRSGWELRPGDAVRIQVVAADLRLRRSEFRLIGVPRGGLRPGERRSDSRVKTGRGRRQREADRPGRISSDAKTRPERRGSKGREGPDSSRGSDSRPARKGTARKSAGRKTGGAGGPRRKPRGKRR